MPSFRRIIAVLLVALWLPVTLHCGLEAAGLYPEPESAAAESGCCQAEMDACSRDACHVLEAELAKPAASFVKAPAPVLFATDLFLRVAAPVVVERTAMVVPAPHEACPENWVPVWSFARRAAAPAHAPDSLIA